MFKNLKKQIESGNGPGPASVILPKTASMSTISNSDSATSSMATLDVRMVSPASAAELHRKPLAVKTVTETTTTTDTQLTPSFDASEMSKLRARNDSLEQAYESYRTKTADLLAKKDSHISRLQERVASLERRLDDRADTATLMANLRTERDELATKLAQLEEMVEAERRDLKAASTRVVAEHERKMREMASEHQAELQKVRSSFADRSETEDALRQRLEDGEAELKRVEALKEEFATQAKLAEAKRSQLAAENATLKRDLLEQQSKVSELTTQQALHIENLVLKKQLYQAQDYADTVDIAAEQQMTTLANQVDDLAHELDDRHRDLNVMNKELTEKEIEVDRNIQRVKTLEAANSRQQEVIENLREELDSEKERCLEAMTERDEVLLRNASLSHEMELVKSESVVEHDRISAELDTVSRELQVQKKLLEGENTLDIIDKLQRKTSELEDTVKERDTTIRLQQQRLVDMKRTLQKELRTVSSATGLAPQGPEASSSTESLNFASLQNAAVNRSANDNNSGNFTYLKHVLLRYMTGSDYECLQLVRAVSAVLQFTEQEETAVWDNLKYKLSWLPTSKPKRRL
uniref:GRIP domain-containing protein n=1 Tax=Plectus sambesii TaxID=2011161 RepID=A0A914VFE3_9BILA